MIEGRRFEIPFHAMFPGEACECPLCATQHSGSPAQLVVTGVDYEKRRVRFSVQQPPEPCPGCETLCEDCA